MPKDGVIELEGKIVTALPNAMFNVELENGRVILASISGKLRMNFIRILVGDRVTVEMSPYDLQRGRITWRHKDSKVTAPKTPVAVSASEDSTSNVENQEAYNQDEEINSESIEDRD